MPTPTPADIATLPNDLGWYVQLAMAQDPSIAQSIWEAIARKEWPALVPQLASGVAIDRPLATTRRIQLSTLSDTTALMIKRFSAVIWIRDSEGDVSPANLDNVLATFQIGERYIFTGSEPVPLSMVAGNGLNSWELTFPQYLRKTTPLTVTLEFGDQFADNDTVARAQVTAHAIRYARAL